MRGQRPSSNERRRQPLPLPSNASTIRTNAYYENSSLVQQNPAYGAGDYRQFPLTHVDIAEASQSQEPDGAQEYIEPQSLVPKDKVFVVNMKRFILSSLGVPGIPGVSRCTQTTCSKAWLCDGDTYYFLLHYVQVYLEFHFTWFCSRGGSYYALFQVSLLLSLLVSIALLTSLLLAVDKGFENKQDSNHNNEHLRRPIFIISALVGLFFILLGIFWALVFWWSKISNKASKLISFSLIVTLWFILCFFSVAIASALTTLIVVKHDHFVFHGYLLVSVLGLGSIFMLWTVHFTVFLVNVFCTLRGR